MKYTATINWCGTIITQDVEAKSEAEAARILEEKMTQETEIRIEAKPEHLPVFDKLGQYKSDLGTEARVLGIAKGETYPLRGVLMNEKGFWEDVSWTIHGEYWDGNNSHDYNLVEFIREIEFPPIDSPAEPVTPKDIIDGPGLYVDTEGELWVTMQDSATSDGEWRLTKDSSGDRRFKQDGIHCYSELTPITRKLIDFNALEVFSHDT